MGTARRQREAAEAARRRRTQRMVWAATACVVLIVVAATAAIVARSQTGAGPPPAHTTFGERPQRAGSSETCCRSHRLPHVDRAGRGFDRGQAGRRCIALNQREPAEAGHHRAGLHPLDTRGTQGQPRRPPRQSGAARVLRDLVPALQRRGASPSLAVRDSLPKRKVAFVSVNADGETAPSVFAFHRYYGLQYPALVDSELPAGQLQPAGGSRQGDERLPPRLVSDDVRDHPVRQGGLGQRR